MLPLPLLRLIKACEKEGAAAGGGLAAFDFSPIHMASHLIAPQGEVREDDVQAIRAGLETWRNTCGVAAGRGYVSAAEEMNAVLSPEDVDALCGLIEANLRAALELVKAVAAQGHVRTFP